MRSMVSRTRSRITHSMVSAPTSRPSPGPRFLLSLPTASSSGTRCPAGTVVGQLRRMMTPSFHFSTTRPTLPRTLVPVGRGDVDNATAALSLHDAHFVLHAQDHAEDVRVERRGIAFRALARDRANLAFGAGIVHRDIETAKPCDGLVDQVADFIVAANVGLDEGGFGTQAAQLGFESLALRFPAARNDDAGTVLGKGQSGGSTDACEGSRDQNDGLIHCATPPSMAATLGSYCGLEKDFVG